MSFSGLIFISPDVDPSNIPKLPRGLYMWVKARFAWRTRRPVIYR